MECDRAEHLMMLHMDQALDETNAALLDAHLKQCPSCREDFNTYNKIFRELSIQRVYSPPADFEDNVMQRVQALDYTHPVNRVTDIVFCVICAVVSIILGTITIIGVYKDTIIERFGTDGLFVKAAELVSSYVSDLQITLSQAGAGLFDAVSHYRFILLLICFVLAGAQYAFSARNKVV